MKRRYFHLIILVITLLNACAPQAPATPHCGCVGTISMELASAMMSQTAVAYSPTPLPSPTFTATPEFIEIPAIPPTPEATPVPQINGQTACYADPGSNYPLISNLPSTKKVEFIGVGSVPGWYVIKNPYLNSLCWIPTENLELGDGFDVSIYPTITP